MRRVILKKDDEVKVIRKVILEEAKKLGIKVEKIILFGSRARRDYKEESDYDILVVTKNSLNKQLEEEFWLKINRNLVKAGIVPEIIIASADFFEKHKKPAYVFYYAEKEGIVIG